MSKRRATRFLVRFVFLGTAAGALAGYSAHAMRPATGQPSADITGSAAQPQQISNHAAKADRLAFAAKLTANDSVTYSLAALGPQVDGNRIGNDMLTAAPALPYAVEERTDTPAVASAPPAAASAPPAAVSAKPVWSEIPAVATTATEHPATAATPSPRAKPKHHATHRESMLLDATHVAGIKRQLQLTPEQVGYWPAVEAALREIGRKQFHDKHVTQARAGKVKIDVNAPEVQKLIWAAMPLLAMLREDQKNEVRKLARVIGLDSVAAQI